MLIVDLSNEIFLENNLNGISSIPAIAYFLRSNVGKLNSLLYEDFRIDPVSLEIVKPSGETISHRAAFIFKVIYQLYQADLDIRGMLFSVNRDLILKATDQEFSIEKVNKSELLKTLVSYKKDLSTQLWQLVHTYRSYQGYPSQVAGNDTIEGIYMGVAYDYVRNI